MAQQNLNNNFPSIIYSYQYDYKSGSVGSVTKIAEFRSVSTPIDLIKQQMVNEINGIKAFRKKLKEDHKDLLIYARP